MKKQFISLTYHFTLGHDSVLIMLSFEVEMQTCQDRKRRDKMTEQTAYSGGSVILRLPFPAITHRGCGIATPTKYYRVALYVFPEYLLGDETLPFLEKKVFAEMLKICQNPFLF